MSAAPQFIYEVASKVETLYQDGSEKFMLHGKLALDAGEGEGQMFALSMPEDLWRIIDCGDTLTWTMVPLEKF